MGNNPSNVGLCKGAHSRNCNRSLKPLFEELVQSVDQANEALLLGEEFEAAPPVAVPTEITGTAAEAAKTILLHRRRTLEERRNMSRPTKPQVKRAKTVGPTEDTGTSGMAPSMEVGMGALNFIPTVFRWWTNPTVSVEENPKKVCLGGSFNSWQPLPMNNTVTGNCWCLIVTLPEGEHEYKFLVDGVWMHNPKDRTISDSNEANSVSPGSGKINLIEVRRSDYEVFEALDNDTRDVIDAKNRSRHNSMKQREQNHPPDERTREDGRDPFADFVPDTDFSSEVPSNIEGATTTPSLHPSHFRPQPPLLPPQLLEIILNKDTPLSCEPSLLPTPNHVMVNHMYALSIQDGVMIMCATKRFRKKYVTSVLYRPIGQPLTEGGK